MKLKSKTEFFKRLFYITCYVFDNYYTDYFICFQENYILGASNDFASRVWSLTDQRLRVSNDLVFLKTSLELN